MRDGSSQRNPVCGYLDLGLPAFRTVRNKFLTSHPVCPILLWKPELANIPSKENGCLTDLETVCHGLYTAKALIHLFADLFASITEILLHL